MSKGKHAPGVPGEDAASEDFHSAKTVPLDAHEPVSSRPSVVLVGQCFSNYLRGLPNGVPLCGALMMGYNDYARRLDTPTEILLAMWAELQKNLKGQAYQLIHNILVGFVESVKNDHPGVLDDLEIPQVVDKVTAVRTDLAQATRALLPICNGNGKGTGKNSRRTSPYPLPEGDGKDVHLSGDGIAVTVDVRESSPDRTTPGTNATVTDDLKRTHDYKDAFFTSGTSGRKK